MHIRKAEFTRVIPSDGILFGEVKVWPVNEQAPMLAWFVRGEDGCLTLAKLIRKQEELELDWYDNDLRQAFADVTDKWFTQQEREGGCNRTQFEREVLDFADVAPAMEQRLWETERDLSEGAVFGAFAKEAGGGETGARPEV
ncbi:hypothetical protein [Gorillibacterium sp. sgz5001074]|uniref:hypothetical protein n=1 Tax=Gorillibacterium sp. sgz5001074 TaxID=3446695 RepID=UPI003F67EB6E